MKTQIKCWNKFLSLKKNRLIIEVLKIVTVALVTAKLIVNQISLCKILKTNGIMQKNCQRGFI